jgi:hypothetical protein
MTRQDERPHSGDRGTCLRPCPRRHMVPDIVHTTMKKQTPTGDHAVAGGVHVSATIASPSQGRTGVEAVGAPKMSTPAHDQAGKVETSSSQRAHYVAEATPAAGRTFCPAGARWREHHQDSVGSRRAAVGEGQRRNRRVDTPRSSRRGLGKCDRCGCESQQTSGQRSEQPPRGPERERAARARRRVESMAERTHDAPLTGGYRGPFRRLKIAHIDGHRLPAQEVPATAGPGRSLRPHDQVRSTSAQEDCPGWRRSGAQLSDRCVNRVECRST